VDFDCCALGVEMPRAAMAAIALQTLLTEDTEETEGTGLIREKLSP
jgi:hypothetical protein